MFKPFKLIDKTNSYNASTSTAGVRVNSTLGPTQKQYKSLIFNSASSQYLNRTFLSAGNSKIWTQSFWFKRGKTSLNQWMGVCKSNPANTAAQGIFLGSDDTITCYVYYSGSAWQGQLVTIPLFRDFSAWYHLLLVVDSTQTNAVDRIKFYINGIQITNFSTSNYPTQNQDTHFNTATAHYINASQSINSFFDGNFAEHYWIDGYAYGPEFFGYFDSLGIWQPKRFAGLYGTNGFYLPLNDSSFIDLVKDKSGNNNNWTLNGYSVSTSISDVVVSDSPVNNYATLNPLAYFPYDSPTSVNQGALSDGNLKFTTNDSGLNLNADSKRCTINLAGKIYFEVTINYISSGTWSWSSGPAPVFAFGIKNISATESLTFQKTYVGACGQGCAVVGLLNDSTYVNSDMPVTGDTMMFAIDVNTGRCWAGTNNVWASSGNPTLNANPTKTFADLTNLVFTIGGRHYSTAATVNFGQRPFKYSPPTGFKTLCSANLPVPSVTNGKNGMDVLTYVGGNSVYSNDSYSGYLKLAMPLNANETYYDISPILSNNLSRIKVPTNLNVTFPTTSPANTNSAVSPTYSGAGLFNTALPGKITIPNNEDFKFGTGDFTVEVWVRFITFPTTRAIVKCSDSNSWANGWSCVLGQTSNRMGFYNGGTYYDTSTNLVADTWYHLAWTRENGTLRQFINGVLSRTDSSITTNFIPTADLTIGADQSNSWSINGYLQDLRVYKGVAKYTSNFTPTKIITTETNSATKTVSGLNFQPDLLWTKGRLENGFNHIITDSLRGNGKGLFTSSTSVENTRGATLLSNGFSYTYPNENGDGNLTGQNYIAWSWTSNSTTTNPSGGTISTNVKANQNYKFSIIKYTGTGNVGSIAHGLGVTPSMFIIKSLTVSAMDWVVWHKNATNVSSGHSLSLNNTTGSQVNPQGTGAILFQNGSGTYVAPDSTKITLTGGTNNYGYVNFENRDFICYAWADVEGYSKFGSYTGNGNSDGPFVYCGFRPRWILIKRSAGSDSFSNWHIYDSVRNVFNVSSNPLYANSTGVEISGIGIDILSNGFKVRDNATAINASADYIFAAFAEYPFKYSRSR